MNQQDEKYDIIVDMLEADFEPTSCALASLEQDAEMQKSLAEGMLLKQAVVRRASVEVNDVDGEWKKFAEMVGIGDDKDNENLNDKDNDKEKEMVSGDSPLSVIHSPLSHFKGGAWGAVAASVAVLVGISVFALFMHQKPYVAYTSQPVLTDCAIITSSSSHRSVVLQNDTINMQEASEDVSVSHNILDALGCNQEQAEVLSVSMPSGKGCYITLADGTEVWMHANSTLTYTKKFVGATREVTLKGEAYFKVAKDASHPFVVHTDHMDARVLGTEINVSSYSSSQNSVALISGSVLVQNKQGGGVRLVPGQSAQIDGQTINVVAQDMETYSYWLNGFIYFDDATLEGIATAIGHWYNCGVVFDTPSLCNYRIRFYCPYTENVQYAVELLNTFQGFEASIVDNVIHIR